MENSAQIQSGKINVKKISVSAVVGLVVVATALLLSAILLNAGKLPQEKETVIVCIALLFGSIVSGVISSRKSDAPKIVSALISGGIIFAVLAICAMAFLGVAFFGLNAIVNLVTIFVGVVCGSIVTTTKGGKRKRKR